MREMSRVSEVGGWVDGWSGWSELVDGVGE